ncbi:response regulator transcription factor [Paenibacillus sp. UNC451MF]|uniref:response regulator transcription factor n=1 Tax=Paenibacillus sp. UNC451MF TaxID=1449063 RepID=UPI00048C86E8|nr:response regulator [Paenibacillus sp. UNC451MF]
MYKVLLVEDEQLIREGIKRLIEQLSSDFTVAMEAVNGKEALTYLDSGMPDLIISDIRMREMDGISFIQEVRKRYAELPIMIISGYQDFHYAQQAIRCEVTDYLLKPINRRAFLTALEKIRGKLNKMHGMDSKEEGNPYLASSVLNGNHNFTIRTVKEYIAAHPEDDLSLKTIADFVDLHPAYLSHLFKGETGQNLSDYITDIRMERAKYLLSHTHLKVYNIARLSGYQSPKHFALVFKQQVGVTPGTYRDAVGGDVKPTDVEGS